MEERLEKRLIQKAQKGDVDAFEQLILGYEKLIYNICLRMLHDEQEAYDGAQEICLKIWRQINAFEGDRKSTRLNSSHSRASRMPSSA